MGVGIVLPVVTLLALYFIHTSEGKNVWFVEGKYTISPESDKKTENIKKVMKILGFNDEDIKTFQEHPTAGDFEMKVLNDEDKKVEIDYITETPKGKHSIKLREGDLHGQTFWNGKKLKGYMNNVYHDKTFGPYYGELHINIQGDSDIGCKFHYRFDEDSAAVKVNCLKPGKFIRTKAELDYIRVKE